MVWTRPHVHMPTGTPALRLTYVHRHHTWFLLAFPQDGCPFSCPSLPLSQDKGRSKCPKTNPSVTSRNKITFLKKTKKLEKDILKQKNAVLKQEKGRSETGNHRKKIVHLMYKIESDCVLGCDGTACKKSHHVLSRGKILNLSSCPFVLGQ